MNRIILIGIFSNLVAISAYAAEWSSRETFGLGYTSNANLTKDAAADEYLRIATTNSVRTGKHLLGLSLSYADYSKESRNDSMAFRASESCRTESPWSLNGAAVGRIYTNSSPGTTDTSFTNFGFDFGASRLFYLSELQFDFEAGDRLRAYTGSEGRTDHNLFGSISLDKQVSNSFTLVGGGEVGLLASSTSDYSRVYLELNGGADYRLNGDWNWSSDLSLAGSSYTSRTISTSTVVNQRRGNLIKATSTARESYSLVTISSDLTNRLTRSLQWGLGLSLMNQSSKSGSLDFNSLDATIKLNWRF